MNRVLLLGSSGFIGRHVEEALLRGGAIVTAPSHHVFDLSSMTPEDIGEELQRARPTAVVNCTGLLDGTAEELMSANLGATQKILAAIAATQPGTRYVRLGSAGEYGRVPFGANVDEDFPPEPVSAYGRSHLGATRLTKQATEEGLVVGCTVRVFNPIGAGMRGNVLASALDKIGQALAEGRDQIEMGPLHGYRDFVDARDLAAAVATASLMAAPPVIVNVGSGTAVTVREAVVGLARRAGFTGDIREAPMIGRSTGVDWIRADITLAERELGWRPQHVLESSLDWISSAVAAERLVLATAEQE